MKISLEITMNQLTELINAIQEDRIVSAVTTIPEKANMYLFNEAFKKLLKKQIDKVDTTKTGAFKISFTYAQAASLWQNLQAVNIRDNYRMSVWISVNNQLHQKLQ